MNTEQERAAFEAWYQHHHGDRDVYVLDESGEYADKQVQGAFNVWQAAIAHDRQDHLRTAAEMMPSDAEILACLRPLYSNDVAAAMGAEDDLRTARLLLSRYAAPVAAQAQPDYPGATVADRLDAMADDCAPGSQRAADLRAAATVWRKHLAGPAAQPKRRPYNASGSLSEYGIFPECDAAPVAAQAPAANYRRVSYVCPVCAASLERQE